MRPHVLASCSNCWFNGLQYGSIGLRVGYCTEHCVVLKRPDETTCGRHRRKDLLLHSAETFFHNHRSKFSHDKITDLNNLEGNAIDHFERSTDFIRHDLVGDVVSNYGEYNTKIESLAQLRYIGSFISELAMFSLARAYTNRCVLRESRNGWKSGIHIFWWTRRLIFESKVPEPVPSDFRYVTAGSLERQVDIAIWSLLMFRLIYISDLGTYAQKLNNDDPVCELHTIAEQAAADTQVPSKKKLLAWLKTVGKSMLERALPESRYKEIGAELRRDDIDGP